MGGLPDGRIRQVESQAVTQGTQAPGATRVHQRFVWSRLIEPYLYPEQGPNLGAMLAEALLGLAR